MAQEVHILRWCDLCIEESKKEPADATPVASRDRQIVDIDLCFNHRKVLDTFYDLAALAVPATRKKRGLSSPIPRDIPCPLCDAMFGTRAGMSGHVEDMHGFSVLQYEGWTKAKTTGEPVSVWCKTCGAGFASSNAAAHHTRTRSHDSETAERRPAKSVYPSELLSSVDA